MDLSKTILVLSRPCCLQACCSQQVPMQRQVQALPQCQFSVFVRAYQYSFEKLKRPNKGHSLIKRLTVRLLHETHA